MKKAKYVIFFLLMLLFARAEILNSIRPFDIGLFIGLIYAGENLAILAPLFILAAFIAEPSVNTLIISITTVLLLAGLYFVSFKLRKRVNLLEINIVAFISRIPILIISSKDIHLLTDNLILLVISQIFVYVCAIALFAILKRGFRNRMTQDELAGVGVIIAVMAISFYTINIMEFMPYYTIAAFVITILIANNSNNSIIVALLIGIGAAFGGSDIAVAATIPLCAIVALMFKRMPIAFIAGAYLLTDIGIGYYFNVYGDYTLMHLISVVAGLVIAVAIPPKLQEMVRIECKNMRKGLAARAVINMSRYELSAQLSSISKAFNDIGIALKKDIDVAPVNNIDSLKGDIARKVCGSCERRDECYNDENGDAFDLFDSIIKGAMDRGRATLVDVPPLLTSICKRINMLTQTTTEVVKTYENKVSNIKEADKGRLLLSDQSRGIATLMDTLSRKTGRSVTIDDNYEERIIEDLAYRNVVCSEVLLINREERGLTLIVRQADRDKKIIDKVLYKRTGMSWIRADNKCEYTNGMTAITFLPAPQYEVLTGECMATKTGSILSGDTRSIIRIGTDKVMVALCDGMGSGEAAESDSSVAIAMIENLYLAGFESDTILSLVNNLLNTSHEESFSALDMAIVDIERGFADFIKLGAVNSFIRTDHGIEVIEGGSLPLGIVEEMKPIVKHRKLSTGELCLIVSDGVIDTIGVEQIDRILINNSALNPQIVSNEIVRACLTKGLKDDITAIAFRIYRRI